MYKYSLDSFCRTMIVNEALFGQSEKQLRMMIEEIDVELNFDFTDFYIFLTGLPKRSYTTHLGMTRVDFKAIFEQFITEIERIKTKYNLHLLHAVVNYDQSKQIVLLIKKDNLNESDIVKFTNYLTLQLQQEYEALKNINAASLANYSVLSDLVKSYDQLAESFTQVKSVSRLAYFDMRVQCVQPKNIHTSKVDKSVIQVYANDIYDCLISNNMDRLSYKLNQLFAILKKSFNYADFNYAMNQLNNIIQSYAEQFTIDFCDESLVYHWNDDSCIEVTNKNLNKLLIRLSNSMASDNERRISSITRNVLLWIKSNYDKDVGLQTVADRLNLNPSYVSRTFSKDMNCSFSVYLTKYRIERAKVELVESNLKISEIAENVGFNNADYFSVVFKKETGMSPQQYREFYHLD